MNKDYYDQIVTKFLSGNASNEETIILRDWIKASPQNKAYYLRLKNLWEISIKPVVLSNEEKEEAIISVFRRSGGSSLKGIWNSKLKVAATIFIPVLAIGLLWLIFQNIGGKGTQTVYNEISTPFGCRASVKLCDGSVVWLNSGSKLTYPDKFDKNKRIVNLSGEALFDVNADPSSPFTVETSEIKVVATGTLFNVKESVPNNKTEVTLAEGKVSIFKPADGTKDQLIGRLNPNQHMSYNHSDGSQSILTEDAYPYFSWKDGKLIFRNEPLKSVVEELSSFFNVDIEVNGSDIEELIIRGTFENESLNEILKLLKLISPIDYKELSRTQVSDGNFSKRKIIIYSKNK